MSASPPPDSPFYPPKPQPIQPQPGHLYDVAVVGAGLAGSELAWRLAQAGRDVLLVSQALDTVGNLYQSSVEGVEFAPHSLFARVQQQMLPQTDGWTFHRLLKAELEATAGIHLLQSCVSALDEGPDETQNGGQAEVRLSTWEGPQLRARYAVLAVGAFLKGRLLIGETMEEAGRLSEVAYDFLADDLARSGVFLMGAEQETGQDSSHDSGQEPNSPGYAVRFLTPAPAEVEGFRLRRFERLYAVGRCLAGEATYRSVLEDAAQLAQQLDQHLTQRGRATSDAE